MDGMRSTGDGTDDPMIEEWLSGREDISHLVLRIPQLTGLLLAVERDRPAEVPDEVMRRWHRLLAAQRRIADQSEPAFIDQARRQGWSWQRIADVLGLPDAEAAQRRQEALAAELDRTHPSALPQPWLGRGATEDPS